MLGSAQRRATPMDMGPSSTHDTPLGAQLADSAYVRPIADAKVLDEDGDPAELAAEKETLRLAFVAALQHLPAKQRAVLILREVLRWQASEVAELLDTSVASRQQRAAARPRDDRGARPRPERRRRRSTSDDEKRLLEDYVKAFEAYDMTALIALLKEDAAFSMPPWPLWVSGPDEIERVHDEHRRQVRGLEAAPTRGQRRPGVRASTTRRATASYAGWAIVVMETSDGRVSGLHHFIYPELFAEFGLPLRLDAEHVGQPDELQQPA